MEALMTLSATTIGLLLLLTGPAEHPARAVADEAYALILEGEYDEAIARLDAAEREQPDPVYVFMRGIIAEERGRCDAAIDHYNRFLQLDVPEDDANEARRRRARCERLLASQPAAPVAPAQPAPTATDTPPAIRPWYADPAGVSLSVIGVAGLVAGAVVFTQARADERAAEGASVLEIYDQRATRAEQWSRAGIATMTVAGVVLLAGIVRYAVVGTSGRRKRAKMRGEAHLYYFGTLGGRF